jgi:hypothetical protein
MSVGIEVECEDVEKEEFDCDGPVVGILKPLVEVIPGVGGFAAAAWDVGCASSKLANGGG